MSEITPAEDKGLPVHDLGPEAEETAGYRIPNPGRGHGAKREGPARGDDIAKMDPVADDAEPPVKTEIGRAEEGGDRVRPGQERNVA